MKNKKNIAKGIVVATAISNIPVDSLASTIEEYNMENIDKNIKENNIGNGIKKFFVKIMEPIEDLTFKPKEIIKVNRNIVEGKVLDITLNEGDFVQDLSGNPDGYEIVRVTTTGDKKLVKADYDKLRLSGIPKVDLSNAWSDSIPAGAFSNATHLTEFKFPQGIKSISLGASSYTQGSFYNCENLTGSLTIPESVTTIGDYAFRECSGFTGSLTIPESVTTIGAFAFRGCSGFTGSLTIPNSVTTIGDYAFGYCSGFTGSLTIPNSVTTIGSFAFSGCSGFTGSLTISNSVTTIRDYAFSGCSGFTGSLTISNSVTTIGQSAFQNCSGFNGNLTLSVGLISISSGAFQNCSGFTGNLTIPESVIIIGQSAFRGCSGFTGNLTIPESVIIIEQSAFSECNKIEKILIKVDSSDIDSNYKESIINNLPNTSQTVVDIPYDLDISGTWLETTPKTVGKPIIKNVVDGVESDLINNKGEAVSLYIPSVYQESNISILKDGEPFALPAKDINNKHIFTEAGVYQVTVTTDLGNTSIITFEVEDQQFKNVEEAVEKAVQSRKPIDISTARDLVNQMPESSKKDVFQGRLDSIFPSITLEKENVTANLDVYIKSENMLSLSLDTNSITFEEYSGAEPVEKLNAVNLTVNSSLPYNLNAYMPSEILSSDGNSQMPIDILNIRESNEGIYKQFENTSDKVVLKESCIKGNNINHSIDLKLDSSDSHVADIYKTVIKFEAEQK